MIRMTVPPAGQTSPEYGVAVLGAGIVGCAVFRSFVLAGVRTVLLERDDDIINGASKGNSGILHTGFDATLATLESRFVAAGYRAYRQVHERLNLPLMRTMAIMVAWNQQEQSRVAAIVAQAHANGVREVRPLAPAEISRYEPALAADMAGGVLVPGESVIDPWSAPLAYVLQGVANGGHVRRATPVTGGRLADGFWHLVTPGGSVRASVVVNCTGNHGDLVEAIARPSPFRITPRKGQFVVFDKSAYALVGAIILPVPTERTKGVVIARTAFGNLMVGPTAEDQEDRDTATVDQATLAALIGRGTRIIPALAAHPITATFAGLRPATQFKDFQIEALPKERWITVSGIRSTGLTASLGIALHVRELYQAHFGILEELPDPVWTPVPNLCEERPRPYQAGARSPIVCHCELVTRREIEDALEGPLPARSLGGLKRRTRCMMGRCQGFYCSRRVFEIARGRLADLQRFGFQEGMPDGVAG